MPADTELREQLYNFKVSNLTSDAGTTHFRLSNGDIEKLMQLIKQRDAAREQEIRLDEARKVYSLTKPSLPNSGSPDTNIKAWIRDREAKLTQLTQPTKQTEEDV